MNKYQEAIDKLRSLLGKIAFLFGYKEDKLPLETSEELNKLQELVDKATPKKPKVISKPYGHLIFEEYHCPVCNAQMGRNNCCSNNDCRQAIDWIKQ